MKLEKALKALDVSVTPGISLSRKIAILWRLKNLKLSVEESLLLDSKVLGLDDEFVIAFTTRCPWADFRSHERRMLKAKDPLMCCYFVTCYYYKCNVEEFRQVVLASHDKDANINFLNNFTKSLVDVARHGEAIALGKDGGANLEFCRYYGGKVDTSINEEAVIKYGSALDNLRFVQEIPNANISRHREAVLESDSLDVNIRFPLLIDSTEAEAQRHYDRAINILITQLDRGKEDLSIMDSLSLLKSRIHDGYYSEEERIKRKNMSKNGIKVLSKKPKKII